MIFGLPVELLEASVVDGLTFLFNKLKDVIDQWPEHSYILGRSVTSCDWCEAIDELVDMGYYPIPTNTPLANEIESINRDLDRGEGSTFDQASPRIREYVLYHSSFVHHWKKINIFK